MLITNTMSYVPYFSFVHFMRENSSPSLVIDALATYKRRRQERSPFSSTMNQRLDAAQQRQINPTVLRDTP